MAEPEVVSFELPTVYVTPEDEKEKEFQLAQNAPVRIPFSAEQYTAPGTPAPKAVPAPQGTGARIPFSSERWIPEKSAEPPKLEGYAPLTGAAVTRAASELVSPIDWYNRGAGVLAEQFGGRTQGDIQAGRLKYDPRANTGSAVKGLQSVLTDVGFTDPDRLKFRDDTDRIYYEGLSSGLGSLAPYGLGMAARLSHIPQLAGAGRLLTYGGPSAQVLPAAGGAALGEAAASSDYVPEEYKGAARFGGEVLGTAAGLGAYGTTQLARKYTTEPLKSFLAPMDTSLGGLNWRNRETGLTRGQQGIVNRSMSEAAGGYSAADRLVGANPLAPVDEAITEFTPFSKYLESMHPDRFKDAMARREQARLGDLTSQVPTGPTADVAPVIQGQRSQLDVLSPGEVNIQQSAQSASNALRPAATTAANEQVMGGALKSSYDQALQDQIDKAGEIAGQVTGRAARGRPNPLSLDYASSVQKLDANGLPTGELDPTKHRNWMIKNDANLTPALRARLQNIPQLQQELQDINAHYAALKKAFPYEPGGSYAGLGSMYFKPGVEGGRGAKQFLELTDNNPAAAESAMDYALNEYRNIKNAFNPDGTVNSATLKKFRKDYDEFFEHMPPRLTQRLDNAGSAQVLLDAQNVARTQAIADFEKSSARFWLPDTTPTQRFDDMLRSSNPVDEVRDLRTKLSAHPEAWNGIKRDFIDYGSSKFLDTSASGVQTFKPQAFQDFVSDNRGVIREMYGNNGLRMFEALSDDIQKQAIAMERRGDARAGAPAALTAGSKLSSVSEATPLAMRQVWPMVPVVGGGGATLAWMLIDPIAAATATAVMGGSAASLVATHVGSSILNNLHKSGMGKVTDRLAMLANDPDLAAMAIRKVPPDPAKWATIAYRMANTGYGAGKRANTRQLEEEFKKTGEYIPLVPMIGEIRR